MFALACLYYYINLGARDRIRGWIVRGWIDIVDKGNWGRLRAGCLGCMPGSPAARLVSAGQIRNRSRRIATARGTSVSRHQRRVHPDWIGRVDRFCAGNPPFDDDLRAPEPLGPVQLGLESSGHGRQPMAHHLVSRHPLAAGRLCSDGRAFSLRALAECWRRDGPLSRRAAIRALPPAAFLWTAAAGMIWFFAG